MRERAASMRMEIHGPEARAWLAVVIRGFNGCRLRPEIAVSEDDAGSLCVTVTAAEADPRQ